MFKKSIVISSSIVLLVVILILGCEKLNLSPIIHSVTATPSTVGPGESSTLIVVATDPDDDELTCTWSATTGTFPEGTIGDSVIWTAPTDTGSVIATATVTDGRSSESEDIIIRVVAVPVLFLDTTSLDFGTANTSLTFTITNTGTGALTWSLTYDQTWVTVNPTNGSTTTETDSITVTVDRTDLDPGTYTGYIFVVSNDGNDTVSISMTVPENPVLSVSPTFLDFDTLEKKLSFDITNAGTGILAWSIKYGQTWVTVNPTSGSTTTETEVITVKVDRTGLEIGTYTELLQVASSGGSDTVVVNMELRETATVSGYTYYLGTTIPIAEVLVAIGNIQDTTGGGGYYELNNVPTGPYIITATKENYDPCSTVVNIPSEGLTPIIEMTSPYYTHNLYGTVTNTLSDSLAGVRVTLLNPDGTESNLQVTTSITGDYQLSMVPEGNRVVRFALACYDTLNASISLYGEDLKYDVKLISSQIGPPSNFGAAIGCPNQITLSWILRDEPTTKGYNLYRSEYGLPNFFQINGSLIPCTTQAYADSGLMLNIYYYKISCVNIDNIEGTLSDYLPVDLIQLLEIYYTSYDSPETAPSGLAWDGSNLWSCDAGVDKIYKHGSDMSVVASYDSPEHKPSGLTWDGFNLWSCDMMSNKIYKHGPDMSVIASYDGPGRFPNGLAWDGSNLWSCDQSTDKIYKHGSDMSVVASYDSPEKAPSGLAWDGFNLWSCDECTGKIYKHSSDMSVITSCDGPGRTLNGLSWGGSNLWSCDHNASKIYKHGCE